MGYGRRGGASVYWLVDELVRREGGIAMDYRRGRGRLYIGWLTG